MKKLFLVCAATLSLTNMANAMLTEQPQHQAKESNISKDLQLKTNITNTVKQAWALSNRGFSCNRFSTPDVNATRNQTLAPIKNLALLQLTGLGYSIDEARKIFDALAQETWPI